jgi:hypothetical protein
MSMGTLRQRLPPYRSRTLLDMSAGELCVRCGREHKRDTVVGAHYTGVRRDSYGGGISEKVHDFLVADLCDECHTYMDSLSRDKEGRWGHSEEFQHYIILTLIKRFTGQKLAVWSTKAGKYYKTEAEVNR